MKIVEVTSNTQRQTLIHLDFKIFLFSRKINVAVVEIKTSEVTDVKTAQIR